MDKRGGINSKGQVALFIILGIFIVGAVSVLFLFRGSFLKTAVPAELEPAYSAYVSCLESYAETGIDVLEHQGGYIEPPEFEPGSFYRPYSSQLDFFGTPVPYWFYISGNNLAKEQVPTRESMEEELSNFIAPRIKDCDFSSLEEEGYDIYVGDAQVDTKIKDGEVSFKITSPVTIFKGETSATIDEHDFAVKSFLGELYDEAVKIYNFEQEELFLEDYSLDVLRTYAPTTGVDISCAPKIFNEEEISEDIKNGLSLNIPTIKLKGDYYDLSSQERKYFVTEPDFEVKSSVNLLYSPNWPSRIEIFGDKVAKPIGLQKGLGALGFCYVPYHLVYDMDFPVMVQLFRGEEFFQFPLAVVISKNMPRESVSSIGLGEVSEDVCRFKDQKIKVHTYDKDLNPVESRIQYRCLNSYCEIGETSIKGGDSVLEEDFPSCFGGSIIASAEGYAEIEYPFSTTEEDVANILMKKKYPLDLNLGDVKKAFVSFESDDYSAFAVYPEQDSVELVEGIYNVSVKVYDDSSLKFPALNERKCVDVPESGLLGVFGSTTEKCFDINIPETDVDFAVIGGGVSENEFFGEETLASSREIDINVPLFTLPRSLDDLQENFIKSEDEKIYISFS